MSIKCDRSKIFAWNKTSKLVIVLAMFYMAVHILSWRTLSIVKGSASYSHFEGCSRLNDNLPYFYISVDDEWLDDKEDIRLLLHNNSSCTIQILTHGQPFRRLAQSKDSDKSLDDTPQVTVQYKINSELQPWIFTTYWPYGDAVNSFSLKSKKAVKFFVARKHLGKKRIIAIPFNYEWEDFQGRAGIEHLLYSPPDLLPDSPIKKR